MKPSQTDDSHAAAITIRRIDAADRAEVELLAQRDSRPIPPAPALGVEIGGTLLAVTSLATGETVADPFVPSADARAVLELRASQLRRGHRRRRTARLPLPGRARAALAGSPPGAGGRLITLGS